jgi:hypothetical protein
MCSFVDVTLINSCNRDGRDRNTQRVREREIMYQWGRMRNEKILPPHY